MLGQRTLILDRIPRSTTATRSQLRNDHSKVLPVLACVTAVIVATSVLGCGNTATEQAAVGCDGPIDFAGFRMPMTKEGAKKGRRAAADQIVACNALDGLSVRELKSAIGKPDSSAYGDTAQSRTFTYFVGPERGAIKLDDEYLFVTIDKQRKIVTETEIGDG